MEKIFHLTGCLAARGYRGIRIWGSARDGGGRSNRKGLGEAASIIAPPFSPRTSCAIVAGFDWSIWTHRSATRKRPHISAPDWGFVHSVSLFFSFLLCFLRHPISSPSLDAPSSFSCGHGKGEDCGSGAREEGDGEGEGEEVQLGQILIKVWSAARLDPGRLDPVDAQPGRHRRSGRGRTDPP